MIYSDKVKFILNQYENTNAGIKANLGRILMSGKLSGTGKLVILPVDQGHEHGPDKSFMVNPEAYDPIYHYELAIEAGLSAYAAPLGFLEAGAETFAGQIPTILKINSSNSLSSIKNQSKNGTVKEALRLGCAAVGFTIYPGSDYQYDMIEEFKEISFESEFLQYSIYLPLASESREAFPSFSGFTTSIGCEIFSSIKSSRLSEIFLPWSSKNFIPLSS